MAFVLFTPGCNGSVTDGFELLTGAHSIALETSMGDITLELDGDRAPKAVTNFVLLTRRGYYEDLTFHRVIDGFMIQGGDPSGTGTGGQSVYGAEFENEDNDIVMDRGVIAMANAGRDTNGSQFFIIQAPKGAPHLQGGYTAFGRVTDGIEIVDKIAKVPTNASDRPLTPVTMSTSEL